MSKVICDICGTAYQSTASKCPICGSSREYAMDSAGEDFPLEDAELLAAEETAARGRGRSKEIFDFDEVNQEKSSGKALEADDFDDEEEDYEEESRTNVGLVIVLVVLIVLLLLVAGFFFVRYLLPNMTDDAAETQPATTEVLQTEPVETTAAGIPCTNLMMDGGKMELGRDGMKLLNVRVYPIDTTDELMYLSGDEAVVTVSEDGVVTAVGEGQTVITVKCGEQQIKCNVTVDYSIGEETVPEEEIPAMQVEGDEAAESTDATGETEASEEGSDETESTESTDSTEETVSGELVLKLKKEDITIYSNRTSVRLELEGDLDPAEVDWFTMDSTVAICHDGVVTSTGSGQTRIYGEYEGQQVMCIVRCLF